MLTDWDSLEELPPVEENWIPGNDDWEWEEVWENNSLVGKRKKRKNP